MRTMGRLLRGELYKMWKSKIILIMVAILTAVIIVMSGIYSHYDKQVSGMISMMLGSDTRVTSFDLLDGKAEELLKEMGISPESLTEFQEAFSKIQDNPSVKDMLLTASPSVLQELAVMTQPTVPGVPLSAPFFTWIGDDATAAGIDLSVLQKLAVNFASYGAFAEFQELLQEDYLNDYVSADIAMSARLERLTTALKNGGQYGRTVVSFIEDELDNFYKDYVAMKTAYSAYLAMNSGESEAAKYEAFCDVLKKYYDVIVDYSSVEFFTKSNVMSTNFLLIPTEGMFSLSYQTFTDSLSPFKSNAYKDSVTAYGKVLATKSDADSVAKFKEDFLQLINPDRPDVTVPPANYDRTGVNAATFLSGVSTLITTIESSTSSIFAYDSNTVQDVFNKVDAGSTLTAAEQKIYDSYKDDKGQIEPLMPAKKLVRSSYSGTITEEIYNSQIKQYFDDKEQPLIIAVEKKLTEARTRYSDAQLIYGLTDGLSGGLTDEQYAAQYADYRNAYAELSSRTATVKNLIVNVNLLESIDANGLKDADAKKIQGFMMSSRYTLRSEITKAQYLISSDHLANEFVAPESLGNGYGAMQFVFVLSSIVILVFGIVLAAGAIAGEHSGGTMKLLLIRPHRRWQVLIAKYLSVVIVVFGLYLFNYLLTLGAGGIFWGLESLNALSIVNATGATVLHPAVVLLIQHVFGFVEAIIFAQISLTLSTVIKSKSGAVSVSMLVYFLSFVLSVLLSGFGWYKYILFNNTNLMQYFTSSGPSLADMTLGFSLIVNAIYIVVLAVVSLFTFAKRDAT